MKCNETIPMELVRSKNEHVRRPCIASFFISRFKPFTYLL